MTFFDVIEWACWNKLPDRLIIFGDFVRMIFDERVYHIY